MEKDELQSALEEAESALEQEENKVLRAQMDLAQGGFQLLDLIITELKSHMTLL